MHYHLPNVELLLARNMDAKRFWNENASSIYKKHNLFCNLLILDMEQKSESKMRRFIIQGYSQKIHLTEVYKITL